MRTPRDSRAKIRLKTAPKQYKRGPGLTGKARLLRRTHNLTLAASRFARQTPPTTETQWAQSLVDTLRAWLGGAG
jgi:hypothetical protein